MTSPHADFRRHAPFVRSDVRLAPFTSFEIGGPADFFAEPEDIEQVQRLRRICRDHALRLRVMGAGTNLLIDDDGVEGLVIRTHRLAEVIRQSGRVRAGVGAKLPGLIRSTIRWELGGLGELAGIPGTVGGAIATNAGTRHGCIGPALETVTGVDADGCIATIDPAGLGLRYRGADLKGMVVTQASFRLHRESGRATAARVSELLAARAASQPLGLPSAGCVFKNPPGFSAGWLIDAAGLKGRACGQAEVSVRHANFIVNRGGASARDVLTLLRIIQQTVLDTFGVCLEPEIQIWRRPGRESDDGG